MSYIITAERKEDGFVQTFSHFGVRGKPEFTTPVGGMTAKFPTKGEAVFTLREILKRYKNTGVEDIWKFFVEESVLP